ncbi:hypothetical protein [Bradyrhizobium sp.]|uniref:hypothetical protein n=1 Tax=Bradyrhizobium sp. TaxID=376 RepID=UPI002BF3242E|nr:hypothetical protein [Bradyrhizobium sp.]HWX61792.1 hypothetical protein [Bradyrhizobium sp.]
MTMIPLLLPAVTAIASWLLSMASWLLARSLNMPQPLLLSTGMFVYAQVQAVESSVGKSLCPRRLARKLRALRRSFR